MDHVRSTQRLPKRCIECSRRKTRCDKTIPCSACIKRNVAHLCAREVVSINGRLKVAVDDDHGTPADKNSAALIKENSLLRSRIAQLELALALRHNNRSCLDSIIPPLTELNDGISEVQISQKERLDRIEHFESTFEAWSKGRQRESNERAITDASLPIEIADLLPLQRICDAIISFVLRELGWIHCALKVSDFQSEYSNFWETFQHPSIPNAPDHSWMALFYSLLSAGYLFVDPTQIYSETMSNLHPSEDFVRLAKHWYKASLKELELSDFTGISNLRNVQAIAVLTLCNGNFGETEREIMLTSVAINAARSLGMDRLGSDATFTRSYRSSSPLWTTRADRELGRRLWWTLVICDWLGDVTRPASISASSFDSVISIGDNDNDILLGCMRGGRACPSPIENHIAMAKLSYIVYVYVKADRTYSSMNITKALLEIAELQRQLPEYLRWDASRAQEGEEWDHIYQWPPWQRYQLNIAFEFTKLTLCRLCSAYLTPGEQMDTFRKGATTAAASLIAMRNATVPRKFEKSWSVSAATLAAGISLGMDLLCKGQQTPSEREDRYEQISNCISKLQQGGNLTVIALKGQVILHRLLQLRDQWERSEGSRKRGMQEIIDYVSTAHPEDPSSDEVRNTGHDDGSQNIMPSEWTNMVDTQFAGDINWSVTYPFFVGAGMEYMLSNEPSGSSSLRLDDGFSHSFFVA